VRQANCLGPKRCGSHVEEGNLDTLEVSRRSPTRIKSRSKTLKGMLGLLWSKVEVMS
jgi:hypothetical protein